MSNNLLKASLLVLSSGIEKNAFANKPSYRPSFDSYFPQSNFSDHFSSPNKLSSPSLGAPSIPRTSSPRTPSYSLGKFTAGMGTFAPQGWGNSVPQGRENPVSQGRRNSVPQGWGNFAPSRPQQPAPAPQPASAPAPQPASAPAPQPQQQSNETPQGVPWGAPNPISWNSPPQNQPNQEPFKFTEAPTDSDPVIELDIDGRNVKMPLSAAKNYSTGTLRGGENKDVWDDAWSQIAQQDQQQG